MLTLTILRLVFVNLSEDNALDSMKDQLRLVLKWLLFFICVWAGLIQIARATEIEKTVFAIDLIRHGDRTPIQEIPKSPHVWKEGLGELTEEGKKQEYTLGMQLRKEYVDHYQLLTPNYLPGTVYVRSTDMHRTIESAEYVMLGLYPLNKRTNNHTITIHTVPKNEDNLLQNQPSKSLFSRLTHYLAHNNLWKQKASQFQNKFNAIGELTGLKINDDQQLISFADNLYIRRLHHVPLPVGLTQSDADEMIALGKHAFVARFRHDAMTYPMGYQFLKAVANYLKQSARHKNEKLKYVLYSGHDSTILSVMNTLGSPLNTIPQYASHLNFLLVEVDSKYFVKVKFNNKPMIIPACGSSTCPLSKFIELAKK